MRYKISVPGRPRPKARPRLSKYGKAYTPKETLDYEKHIRKHAKSVVNQPLIGEELTLIVRVYFSQRNHGDLDNYIKIASDALNKFAYDDDKQIKQIQSSLSYVHSKDLERMEIEVTDEKGRFLWITRKFFTFIKSALK